MGVLLALGLVGALLWPRSNGPTNQGSEQAGRVYSVGEIVAALQQRPMRWVGQVIRIRAVAWPCLDWATGPCLTQTAVLADPGVGGSPATMALAGQRTSPLLALLRGLPLVDALLPAPQTPRWGRPATYRVRILAVLAAACVLAPCYQALLEGW
ncbi:MAG TPA: hypothetical protein VHB98_18630 [Chloroflexota bacterium]|nr:hypothetical protein [Chloroflexota bacterium]